MHSTINNLHTYAIKYSVSAATHGQAIQMQQSMKSFQLSSPPSVCSSACTIYTVHDSFLTQGEPASPAVILS